MLECRLVTPSLLKLYLLSLTVRYGVHPRTIVSTRDGWKAVSSTANPFTGKSDRVMTARADIVFGHEKVHESQRKRAEQLNGILLHGASWCHEEFLEPDIRELISSLSDPAAIQKLIRRAVHDGDLELDEDGGPVNAVRTPSSRPKHQKRQGARQVKKCEQ